MAIITQETRFTLDTGERIELAELRDHLLVCETGRLRIAPADGAPSVILGADDRWHITGNNGMTVLALTLSTLRLEYSQAFGPLAADRHIARWRRFGFPPLATFPAQLIR